MYQYHWQNSIMLPPPCWTVGTMFFCLKLHLHLQTYLLSLWPDGSVFVFSVNKMSFPEGIWLGHMGSCNFQLSFKVLICDQGLLSWSSKTHFGLFGKRKTTKTETASRNYPWSWSLTRISFGLVKLKDTVEPSAWIIKSFKCMYMLEPVCVLDHV